MYTGCKVCAMLVLSSSSCWTSVYTFSVYVDALAGVIEEEDQHTSFSSISSRPSFYGSVYGTYFTQIHHSGSMPCTSRDTYALHLLLFFHLITRASRLTKSILFSPIPIPPRLLVAPPRWPRGAQISKTSHHMRGIGDWRHREGLRDGDKSRE